MTPRHMKTSVIIGPIGTLAVGVILALGVAAYFRVHEPVQVFEQRQLSAGVATVLDGPPPAGYGLTDTTQVVCPPDITVKAGNAFRCSLQIGGAEKSVQVLVTGDDDTARAGGPPSGEYLVAVPA